MPQGVIRYGEPGLQVRGHWEGPKPNGDLDTVTKLFNAEPCPSRGVGAVDSYPLDIGV